MMNLFNSFKPNVSKTVVYFLLGLSLIGLADAAYLTTNHYIGEKVACSVVAGCEIVLTSKYSEIFGVPVALLGVVYYSTAFLLAYVFLISQSAKAFKLLSAVVGMGMVATIYFVTLQLFVIKAICQYCMISAFTTTILVSIIAWVYLKSNKEIKKQTYEQ